MTETNGGKMTRAKRQKVRLVPLGEPDWSADLGGMAQTYRVTRPRDPKWREQEVKP